MIIRIYCTKCAYATKEDDKLQDLQSELAKRTDKTFSVAKQAGMELRQK